MIDEAGTPQPGENQAAQAGASPSRWHRFRQAYRQLSTGMQITVASLLTIAAPLLFPALAIEWIIHRWHKYKDFEFGIISSTPYFLFVAVIAAVGVVFSNVLAIRVIALYLLALMELISLSVCATIAVISPGRLQTLNLTVAIRSFTPRTITASRSTVYAALVSAGYAVYFFGILSYALWQADPSYFEGVSEPSTRVYSLWQFVQNSFLTITNAGATLVSRRFLSQLIGDFERIVGIFLLVFLLSVLASGWTERALRRANLGAPPEE